jgi:hypothetical protein
MLGSVPSIATLVRWLGPWADAAKAPDVATSDTAVDGMRVRLYRPSRAPRATFLIAPGLHYAGPDDVRMDRFCRIPAAGGHLVVAPFIPLTHSTRPGAAMSMPRVVRALETSQIAHTPSKEAIHLQQWLRAFSRADMPHRRSYMRLLEIPWKAIWSIFTTLDFDVPRLLQSQN